jgi:phospholipase/carboxylesterase
MPEINMYWRTDRPTEGFYTTQLPSHPQRPVRTFLPNDYQPRYPYPLVVLFHGRGGSEEQVLRLAPKLSRRNYICISLRGPQELGVRPDGRVGFGWGAQDHEAETEEYLMRAVEQTRRSYHVHSERVFLAGVGQGASVAYRMGFRMADRIAGLIALNGAIPAPGGRPLFNLRAIRDLRVLIGHGIANTLIPFARARRDHRLLYAAGADVKLIPYRTTHDLHQDMTRDVNQWIMGTINAYNDVLVNKG